MSRSELAAADHSVWNFVTIHHLLQRSPHYITLHYTTHPLTTPSHIQPQWYFLWLYAILRSIPNKLGGVIALISAILILYLPPLLNNKHNLRFSPPIQLRFFIILTSWFILRWIGSCPVEEPFITIGQIFSLIYFLYFLYSSQVLNIWFFIINK